MSFILIFSDYLDEDVFGENENLIQPEHYDHINHGKSIIRKVFKIEGEVKLWMLFDI